MGKQLETYELADGHVLEIIQGDITEETVDAIVNAANSQLQHGGGVAAVIVKKGGSVVQDESNQWIKEKGPVSHEQPAYTRGGNLPAKYIIHAVGPVWGDGDEDRKLTNAIQGSLRLADKLSLYSIAFPAISTGIFGFPKERAAIVIYNAIQDFFDQDSNSKIETIRITLYDKPTVDDFLKAFKRWKND